MKTLVLNIPESIDLDEQEATMLLATKLYGWAKLSLGQEAELAGYSKLTFTELLSRYNIPIINSDLAGLENHI